MKTLTPERFNEILSAFQAKQTDTLATKAKEYSQDGNRLHNFDIAIKLINLVKPSDDRTYSMWCLNSKQLVSVIVSAMFSAGFTSTNLSNYTKV